MSERVAGHIFSGTIDGDRCIECGRLWAELEDLDTGAIGKDGLAHVGTLNAGELDQIQREKKRRRDASDRAWSAVVGVCT